MRAFVHIFLFICVCRVFGTIVLNHTLDLYTSCQMQCVCPQMETWVKCHVENLQDGYEACTTAQAQCASTLAIQCSSAGYVCTARVQAEKPTGLNVSGAWEDVKKHWWKFLIAGFFFVGAEEAYRRDLGFKWVLVGVLGGIVWCILPFFE